MSRELFANVGASKNGRWIVGGFVKKRDDSVALWDAHSGRLLWEKPLESRLTAVALDAASETVVAESLSGPPFQYFLSLFFLRSGQRRALILPHSEGGVGLSPEFTAEGRLLIQTSTQLEWWDPRTGQFLSSIVPHREQGLLLSTNACGSFRVIEAINTPYIGDDTRWALEVRRENDASLVGMVVENQEKLVRYATQPERELVAILLRVGERLQAKVFSVKTLKQVAAHTFPTDVDEEGLAFSPDGAIVYVGRFHPRAWRWQTDIVRHTHHNEVRTFSTFYLCTREVYFQYWDGMVRDVRTDKPVVQLCR